MFLKVGDGLLRDEGLALGVWAQILASGAELATMPKAAVGGGG